VKVWIHFTGPTFLLFAFYFYLFGTPNIIGCIPHRFIQKEKKHKNLGLFCLVQIYPWSVCVYTTYFERKKKVWLILL